MAYEWLIPEAIDLLTDWYRGKEQKEAISESTDRNAEAQKDIAELQYKAQTEAADLEERMFKQAIEEAQKGNMQSLVALLSGQQFNYDTARAQQLQQELNAQQQQQQAMSWMLPQKAVSLAALQSFPMLTKALGGTPFKVPTSIDTSPSRVSTSLPNIDFAQLYNNAYRNQLQQQGLNDVVQSGASQGAYVPMTPGGNIPSMLPGMIPNTTGEATPVAPIVSGAPQGSVRVDPAKPTTEQVVQAAAEQGASPEQIRQLIYDFEALDPAMFNTTQRNPAYDQQVVYNAGEYFSPFEGGKDYGRAAFGAQSGTLIDGDKAIRKGAPMPGRIAEESADYKAYMESLKPLVDKLNRAKSIGDTANAARYQDIYNFYTGKPVSKDSTAFTYRPPTPTQSAPTAPTAPTQPTYTPPDTNQNTGTPSSIRDFLTAEYAKAQTQPSSYNLQAYTPEEAAAIPDFTASPLYKWQLQEATDAARKRQIKEGLGNSTYGDRELSRVEQSLEAEERERWVRDQLNMVNIGMGYKAEIPTAQVGQANLSNNFGTNLADLFKNQSNNLSDLYTKYGATAANNMQAIGNIYGQSALNQAGIYGQGQLAQAAVSPWYNNLGSNLSGLFSNNNRNTGRNPTNSTYLYNTSNTPLDVANSYAGIPYSGLMY